MAFIGSFSRALLESATAVYFGGASVSILDAQGNVLLGDDLPGAPTITSTISDRTYALGDAAVTVDLRTKFSDATSYTVSPTNAAVTIDGYTLTINPAAAMTSTSFTVRGVNGGGQSAPLAFTLTVTAPAPVLIQPFPDQSLLIGGGTVTLPLAEFFSGATGYAVSPANNGVTISNGNLVISRTTARDVIITVTATNATGQDTSDSFALLIAAPANQAPVASAIPQQTPTANVAFTSNLSSYFVDPDGENLIFDYTGTLPTGITRNGAVFSGTATVTDQTASGVLRARDPGNLEAEAPVTWAVSAQPTMTATVSPNPLIAGQPGTITFNTAPDSVTGNVTFTGTGMTRSFTAPSDDTVNVSGAATKAGYTSLPFVYDVVPADPIPVLRADGTVMIANMDELTEPATLSIVAPTPVEYRGNHVIGGPGLATGPHEVVLVKITGTATVGSILTRHMGLWASKSSNTQFEGSWPDGTDGPTYVVRSADAGTDVTFSGEAIDEIGTTGFESNAIAIPASVALANGITNIGSFNTGENYATIQPTRSQNIDLGPADPDKTLVLWLTSTGGDLNSGKITAGGVDYPVTVRNQHYTSHNRLILATCACPAGGSGVFEGTFAAATYQRPAVNVWATKGVAFVSSAKNGGTLTAGTVLNRTVSSTQAGDLVALGIVQQVYVPDGAFNGTTNAVETADIAVISGTYPVQLYTAIATAAGTSTTISVMPEATGAYCYVTAIFRSV